MFARLSGVTIASLWLVMAGVPARSASIFYPRIISAPPQGSALQIAQTPTTPETPTPTPIESPKPPESETPTPAESPKPPESAVSPINWQAFTTPQGRFSIDFPGVPSEQVEPADATTRRLETGAYIWESPDSVLGYGAFYKVFNGTLTNEQARTFLDRFLEDFVANGVVSGKLLSNRAIAINNYLGREIEVEGAEGYIKARMYLIEDRLYLLTAVSPSKTTYPRDGDRFFDSFKLR